MPELTPTSLDDLQHMLQRCASKRMSPQRFGSISEDDFDSMAISERFILIIAVSLLKERNRIPIYCLPLNCLCASSANRQKMFIG